MTLPDFFAQHARPRRSGRRARCTCSGSRTSRASTARSSRRWPRATELHVYTLNPCREFWEDLEPRARRGAERSRAVAAATLAARMRRRRAPRGRDETIRCSRAGGGRGATASALNQLTTATSIRFVDPAARAPSLLATLQAEVLERRPVSPRAARRDDDSLTVVPAPDPRRELETIAAEIWSRGCGADDRTLRFADFAVIVPAASAPRLPAARAGGVRGGVAPAAHDRRSPPPRRAADPRGGRAPAGAAARLAGAAGSAARWRCTPRSRAASPTSIPRTGWRSARSWRSSAAPTARDQAGELPRRAIGSAGTRGCGAWRWARFCRGRASGEERPFVLDGEPVLPAELPPGLRAGRPRARDPRARADRLRATRRAAPRRRSRPTRRSCGARSPRRSSPSPATRRRRSATASRALERRRGDRARRAWR